MSLKSFASFAGEEVKAANSSTERKREGKYIDLPGAEMGKVIVRFPPEASGYLHVGHAKAALLNQYYQQAFKGKLILRFDDTNPAKETEHFEKIILEDLKTLGVHYDIFTRTSHHFDKLLELCEQLIKQGDAYVDDTDAETMKKEREARQESKNRNNSVQTNLSMWEEMKKGSEKGQKCCVRAKIDMSSDNGCLRDPTMYRCKNEAHVTTGTKYKVYPTYDFACPVVDSVEGVTHALRTTEYHDRDDQYFWVLEKLKLRKPHIWEYSRLNLQHTVMSKRKLTWLVDEGYVSGWDDPRLPTVRGVFRRGMTVEGLREFIVAQGSSKSVVTMDWSKIWSINKQAIDPKAPRFVAVLKQHAVEVQVAGGSVSSKPWPKHPKNENIGMKTQWFSDKLLIDQNDAAALSEGETATFVNLGNVIIEKIEKDSNTKLVTTIKCKLNLENQNFKNTQKFTWLALTDKAPLIPTTCVHFGPILSKPVIGKDDNFKDCVNTDSLFKFDMVGEPDLATLKKGDIIQLMRRGYYIVDEPYLPPDATTTKARPIILFHVPDGHVKELPTAVTAAPTTAKAPAAVSKQSSMVDADALNQKIAQQGDKIRQLKSSKAAKDVVEPEVKTLLALKADYKKVTGKDWAPGAHVAAPASQPASGGSADDLGAKISAQGDKVRKLKSEKAAKDVVDAEVKVLLSLKADFKKATGKDWTPGATTAAAAAPAPTSQPQSSSIGGSSADAINDKITEQGNKIRQLKSEKAAKAVIDPEIQTLLALKAEYKKVTGKDWAPGVHVSTGAQPSGGNAPASNDAASLDAKISEQGNKVRQLKSEKAAKVW